MSKWSRDYRSTLRSCSRRPGKAAWKRPGCPLHPSPPLPQLPSASKPLRHCFPCPGCSLGHCHECTGTVGPPQSPCEGRVREAPGGREQAEATAAGVQGDPCPPGCAVFLSEQGLAFQVKTPVQRVAGIHDRLGLTENR